VTLLNRKRGATGNTKYAYVKEPYYVYSTMNSSTNSGILELVGRVTFVRAQALVGRQYQSKRFRQIFIITSNNKRLGVASFLRRATGLTFPYYHLGHNVYSTIPFYIYAEAPAIDSSPVLYKILAKRRHPSRIDARQRQLGLQLCSKTRIKGNRYIPAQNNGCNFVHVLYQSL